MKKQFIAILSGVTAVVTGCAHGPGVTSRGQVEHNVAPRPRVNEVGQPAPEERAVPADQIEIVQVDALADGTYRINGKDCEAGNLGAQIAEFKRTSGKSVLLVNVREHPGVAAKNTSAIMDAVLAAEVVNVSVTSVD